MSVCRSTFGEAHDELLRALQLLASSPLAPERRAEMTFAHIASTPLVWPMDDIFLELLLSAAGFDLQDADHLHAALWVTALLVAGDRSYDGLYCGHEDRPSTLCAIRRDSDIDSLYSEVMDLAEDGEFDHVDQMRARRYARYGVPLPWTEGRDAA